ncbi:MAG: nitrilase-related carbon-nitrogen hydrolase [Oscillospiraceae bacterium]
MRNVTVAAIQMSIPETPEKSVEKAEKLVRKAAAEGANVILLPELFENWYFCQERRYDSYKLALPLEENPAVRRFQTVAKELSVVLPISFYEQDGNVLYNSVAMIDADGSVMGVYRKTHIPDDHFYQEKFYFTPGDTGFKVWDTRFGKIGVGICWDQWFPEAARCMALDGAELLFYPTAIGPSRCLECDSMPHWQRCMQGHAAHLVPVIAANRIGHRDSHPGQRESAAVLVADVLRKRFIADNTGALVECADRTSDTILLHTFDLDELRDMRLSWGVFRDRRPEMYGRIAGISGLK